MEKISKTVLVLTFPLLVVLLAADVTIFDQRWYEQKFEQYGVYKTIDASKTEVDAQAKNILEYIQSKASLQPTLLNEKEQRHMADVQQLVTKGHQLLVALVMLQLVLWIRIKEKRKTLLYGSLLTLVLLGAIVTMPFEKIFTLFHLAVFTNDLWLLNPLTDNLVNIYPQGIFQTLAIKIGITTSILAVIGMAISLYKQKWQKKLWQKS